MHEIRRRDYQIEALQASHEAYRRGVNRQLIRMATGMGKTSGVAAFVPVEYEDLVETYGLLFVVHRREVLLDAAAKYRAKYPHKSIGIEMGEFECLGIEDMIFASVDSIGRVMQRRLQDKYHHRTFGVIITDEGHHVTPNSTWDNVLTYFGVGADPRSHFRLPDANGRKGPKPLSLFLTATPNRHDGQGLEPVVDEIVADYDYAYGVRNGWLVDIRALWLRDKLGITGADEAEGVDADMVIRAIRDYGKGHSTLVFARNVPQSKIVVDTLNAEGIARAAHVDGMTDKKVDRPKAIRDFKNGDLDVLSNFGVFREGTDVPGVTLIVDNAPTESQPIFAQKVGRGSRPHPLARVDDYANAAERRAAIAASPKPHLVYIATFDPTKHPISVAAALTGRDDLPTEGTNDKLIIEEILDKVEELEAEQPERPIREIKSLDDLELALHDVDFWGQNVSNEEVKALTDHAWVIQGDEAAIWLPENPFSESVYDQSPAVLQFVQEPDGRYAKMLILEGGYNPSLGRAIARKTEHRGYVDDLNGSIQKVDRWLQQARPDLAMEVRRGLSGPATDKQKRYMKRHKIGYGDGVTEGTAALQIANHRISRLRNLTDV